MANKVLLLTTNTYDENEYEAVGTERGITVHAISLLRGFAGNLVGVFGGSNDLIAKKIEDVYEEAMAALIQNALKTYGNIDKIIALDIDLSEMSREFIICVASGTVLRKKGSKPILQVSPTTTNPIKGGKTRKHKYNNKNKSIHH